LPPDTVEMERDLLLVGSVPLDTAEQVMRVFGPPLGPFLASLPDGEVGDRRWWALRLSWQVFLGHPELELLRRPAPDNGVERLVPRDRADAYAFKVKPGVERVRFGQPGWRLGFARDALNSYFVFKTLKKEGVIAPHLRFQISLPLVNSVVTVRTFPEPGDLERVRPGYEEALRSEIAKIAEIIPAEDLAVQWDCSWEITDMYGGIPGYPLAGALERNIGQVERLSSTIPKDALVGFHFCFGTFGGWPRFAPDDLGAAVDFANATVVSAGRKVDWIHIPALDRADEAFYAPLARLKPRGTKVYLGLIHNMRSFAERLKVARAYAPAFGLAAYCGFGRMTPEALPQVIKDHLYAIRIAASEP
jgi:hypothetical protein